MNAILNQPDTRGVCPSHFVLRRTAGADADFMSPLSKLF